MENTTSRIIIETMVSKALRDIKDSPKRSTRNIIDMALNFSDGRFQKHFFTSAQSMLKNEQSAYYDLVLDVVSHVETDRLVGFGMNLGYNGCTKGAQKIREIEEKEHYNIPWTITLMIDENTYMCHEDDYRALVQQGKQLGIFVWQLCITGNPNIVVSLIEENTDCAFAVFCDPDSVTEEFLENISEINHVMLVIRYNADAPCVCHALRERKLLYSVFTAYDAENSAGIVNGEFFLDTEELHPAFTMLTAKAECPAEVCQQVYNAVTRLRADQTLHSIPWETAFDANFVDNVISSEPCTVFFDDEGYLHNWNSRKNTTEYNIFCSDLVTILKSTQKKRYTN